MILPQKCVSYKTDSRIEASSIAVGEAPFRHHRNMVALLCSPFTVDHASYIYRAHAQDTSKLRRKHSI